MSEVQKELLRLALEKHVEKDKPKKITYLGADMKLHTVEEGELVRVEPKSMACV